MNAVQTLGLEPASDSPAADASRLELRVRDDAVLTRRKLGDFTVRVEPGNFCTHAGA
jgi:hypothetical protein